MNNIDTARRFQALSDPTRLEIIGRLTNGECCVCELTDSLDAAQSRLSFHLKVLKDAGLIVGRKQGRWNYYCLDADAMEELAETVNAMREAARGCAADQTCCA
jgi:ArsR family transcriptional regulator